MTILIAESDGQVRHTLETHLRSWGHQVVSAGDGREALDCWGEDDDIQLVLADWQAPGLDGLELCRRIRQDVTERDAYLVLLTPKDEVADRVAALQSGADDFLPKPVQADDLRARVAVGERIVRRLAAMRKRALVDDLTGLRNRRAFEEDLRRRLAGAGRHDESLGLVLVDIARFKTINDQFGHSAGDVALRHVASHLIHQVRDSDDCYRIGGDEFAVLLYRAESAKMIADRLASQVAPLSLADVQTPLALKLSIGAATKEPDQALSTDDLLGAAHAALSCDRERQPPDGVLAGVLSPESPSEKLALLVAESDSARRHSLVTMLRERGYDVVTVEDGEDAWRVLDSTSVPFVIAAWAMPGLDGLQLCHRIRTLKRPQYTYVMLVIAEDRPEDVITGLAAGADDYLTSPFSAEDLIVRVRAGERVLRLEDQYRNRVQELEQSLTQVQQLEGLLPICAYCKKVRDDDDYWQQIESFIASHTRARFSHGICPDCFRQHVEPSLKKLKRRRADDKSPGSEAS